MLARDLVDIPAFDKWRGVVEERVRSALSTDLFPSLAASVRYAGEGGGKLFRPLLTCAMTTDLGGCAERFLTACNVGAAVELLHAASLVHDDLPALDNDLIRRGKPSLHVAFGEGTAVLTGDALVGLAFRFVTESDASDSVIAECLRELSQAWIFLCDGQVRDISGESTGYETIRRKTGALFSAALTCGYLISGNRSEGLREAIGELGYSLGIVFQLLDDVIDTPAGEGHSIPSARVHLEREKKKLFAQLLRCNEILSEPPSFRDLRHLREVIGMVLKMELPQL